MQRGILFSKLIYDKEFGINSGVDDTTVCLFWMNIAFSWDFGEALARDSDAFLNSRFSYQC